MQFPHYFEQAGIKIDWQNNRLVYDVYSFWNQNVKTFWRWRKDILSCRKIFFTWCIELKKFTTNSWWRNTKIFLSAKTFLHDEKNFINCKHLLSSLKNFFDITKTLCDTYQFTAHCWEGVKKSMDTHFSDTKVRKAANIGQTCPNCQKLALWPQNWAFWPLFWHFDPKNRGLLLNNILIGRHSKI